MSNPDVIYHFFIVLRTCSIMIKFNHIFEFSSQFSHWQNFAMPPVIAHKIGQRGPTSLKIVTQKPYLGILDKVVLSMSITYH